MAISCFKIYSLGCKVNQYDGADLAAKLSAVGLRAVKNGADLAIVNTCAVTKRVLVKDRQMVARARRENPDAKIVVTGCAARVYGKEAAGLGADLVVEEKEAEEIIELISKSQIIISKQSPSHKSQTNCEFITSNTPNKSRYFLKIQDGCRQFCSYCIIPYARGEFKSRPVKEVVAEVKRAVARGYKEIILCGIHLGQFGIDRKTQSTNSKSQTNLVGLLTELNKIKNLGRIRLSSIEVNEVTDELIDLIKTSGKICRHLHVPLQSGCDKILKLMNRPYTTKIFADKVKKIRQALPGVAITTDVIVGFPGESVADFKTTVEFIKKINPSKLHVFPFSAHERTPAAAMPGQLSEAIKARRSAVLNRLSARLEKAYQKKFQGKKLAVIIDGRSREGRYRGKSEYYFDVTFSAGEKYRPGEVVEPAAWKLL